MMRARHLKLGLLIAIASLQVGCATQVGNARTEDVGAYLKLQKDISTKRDVYDLFGQPAKVVYLEDASGSTWQYIYVKMGVSAISFIPVVGLLAGGVNSDYKVGTMYFDINDRYVDVRTESASKYTSHWVGVTKGAVDTLVDQNADAVKAEMERYGLPFDPELAGRLRGIDTVMKTAD